MSSPAAQRDQRQARTPMRCPICGGAFDETLIRDLGTVTQGHNWQLHAGHCPDHGWFQAEVISRPPREIFAVNKPFGAAREVVLDGKTQYSFPTAFNDLNPSERRNVVNPMDPSLWAVKKVYSIKPSSS